MNTTTLNSAHTPSSSRTCVRIGGASGFWGDSMLGATQLVQSGLIDYLVFDYLAETTMAIMAAVRTKKPEMGYATDFVDMAMKAVLPEVMQRGIKVVANAGGMNPQGCADALQALAHSMGLSPKIAVVLGDDISAQLPALREAGTRDRCREGQWVVKAAWTTAYSCDGKAVGSASWAIYVAVLAEAVLATLALVWAWRG